jgi:hypothetical protein
MEPAFLEYCLTHQSQIRELISTRRVQTNEVRRCSYMLPAYEYVWQCGERLPLSVVDVGASAGLHMLWNRYQYSYGQYGEHGDPKSPVNIECEVRGEIPPPLPHQLPDVAFTIGVDLNPVDLTDRDTVRWFRALIWPEHADRIALFQAAIQIAVKEPPQVVKGNAVSMIPAFVAMAPDSSTLCLYHSHVLYQLPKRVYSEYEDQVRGLAKDRDIYWLSAQADELEMRKFSAAGETSMKLANIQGHGRWFEWLAHVSAKEANV